MQIVYYCSACKKLYTKKEDITCDHIVETLNIPSKKDDFRS